MNKKGCLIAAGTSFLVLLFVGIIAISSFVGTYNSLQTLDESVNSSWAQVENQLKRRNDLIPNLVATVKGYANQEKEIFTSVADARARLAGAIKKGDIKDVNAANAQMTGALSRLLAVVENYPQLKSDKVFIGLQDELAGTENRLSVARRDYNESVKIINTRVRRFPANIIAGIVGVEKRTYFEIEESEKATPKVEF